MKLKGIFIPITWVAQIFTEPDGNGGKASFSRVVGAFVIWNIIKLGNEGKPIPDSFLTMFWVLIGYSFLSKALNSLSPAALDLAKATLTKVQSPEK